MTEFIDEILNRIPDGKAKDKLIIDLSLPKQAPGAFFELLAYHFLEILEHKFIYQPETLTCHPDFLVEPDNNPRFIIDAKVMRARDEIRNYRNKSRLLKEKIHQYVQQPYAFSLISVDFPKIFDSATAKKWARMIDDELNKLGSTYREGTVELSVPGCSTVLKFNVEKARDEKPHYRGWVGKGFGGGDTKRLRDELLQKVREQYENMDLPVVLAVGEKDSLIIDMDTVRYALYGDPVLSWDIETTETETGLGGKGLFLYGSYESETRKKISAVVGIFQSLYGGQNAYDVCVFHNPCANTRLEPEIFKPFYQVAYDAKTGVEEEIGERNGKMVI